MSRLMNLADPADKAVIKKMMNRRANGINEILADPESHAALMVLKSKGLSPSLVHGAYSTLLRRITGGASE